MTPKEPSTTPPEPSQGVLQLLSNQSIVMPLSFQRQQAGEYNVIENGKMVGYIQKANASKWITYFCSNPSIKGKPQNVSKTLKDSKAFCENYFMHNDAPQVNIKEDSPELDSLLNDVRNHPDKVDLMREMLKNPKTISMDDIDIDSTDLSDIVDLGEDIPFSHFLDEQEALAL